MWKNKGKASNKYSDCVFIVQTSQGANTVQIKLQKTVYKKLQAKQKKNSSSIT